MRPTRIALPQNETLFHTGVDYFESLLASICLAQKTIIMESYIFKNDIIGSRVIDALVNAKNRGVNIKVMVDGVGSPFFRAISDRLDSAKIETKIYHPFPWHIWHWSRSVVKLPIILKSIYLLLNMPKRNHRKICLIDNRILFAGSLNIAKEHLPTSNGGDGWRDLGIKIELPHFNELTQVLEQCWNHRSIKEVLKDAFKKIGHDPLIRLNFSRHRRRILHKQLLRKIHHAQQRIWITNPYFVPDDFLLRKLRDAAKRGCDVRILLPSRSDTLLPMPWAAACTYERLLQSGVRIFEYQTHILHAKSIIIDNWMIVGSSNMDYLSLHHNQEIDIRLSFQTTKDQARKLFLRDLKQSTEIRHESLKHHKSRRWFQRGFGRLMLILRYWI